MEPESSLFYSQNPANEPKPEAFQFIPHHDTLFLQDSS